MTTTTAKFDAIKEYLESTTDENKVYLWNEYCCNSNGYDYELFDYDTLIEYCNGQDADWIIGRVYFGKFEYNSPYFKFNGYGNFESVWNPDDEIDYDAIADYCIENDEDFSDGEIRDILNGDD